MLGLFSSKKKSPAVDPTKKSAAAKLATFVDRQAKLREENEKRSAKRQLGMARFHATIALLSGTLTSPAMAMKKVDDVMIKCGIDEQFIKDTEFVYHPEDLD